MGIINPGIANLTFLASASYFIIRGDVSFFRRDNYATKVLFIQNAFAVTNRNWKSFLQICKDVFCCEALREMELNSLNSKTFWKPPQHSVSKLLLASLNMKWGEKRTLVLLLKLLFKIVLLFCSWVPNGCAKISCINIGFCFVFFLFILFFQTFGVWHINFSF